MRKVLWRCNGGDYFSTVYCPFDGWSSENSAALFRAVDRLQRQDTPLTLAALKDAGLSDEAIRSCVIIEFGDSNSAFEALSPSSYVVNGQAVPLKDVGKHLK